MRSASPDAGGLPLPIAGDASKELPISSQDEVILQLENELVELKNACAAKDQRIAELSRNDGQMGRLKRDVRALASELHEAQKQLGETMSELQDLRGGRSEVMASPYAGASDNERMLQDSVTQLQDENWQLKETLARLQMGESEMWQQSHISMQRPADQVMMQAPVVGAQRSMNPGPARGYQGQPPVGAPVVAEEQVFQVVYSTTRTEKTVTLGPTTLQGVGTVDGVNSVAKLLLSRLQSSICSAQRRPMMPAMVQPFQPGALPSFLVSS